MTYEEINNKEDLLDFIECLWEHNSPYYSVSLKEFCSAPNRTIYGHFGCQYYVYGETITPDEIHPQKGTIWEQLKAYGSSKKYRGIVNHKGEVTIAPMFNTIELLWNNLIKVERNKKYGVYSMNGDLICPLEYDAIYEVSECVFGVRKDGKIGFMNLKGEIVIPLIFDDSTNTNYPISPLAPPVFANGLACVLKIDEQKEFRFGYIDHYGNLIYPFIFDEYKEYIPNMETRSTLYVDDGTIYEKYQLREDGEMWLIDSNFERWTNNDTFEQDSYDNTSDAYEGDDSNKWNTD